MKPNNPTSTATIQPIPGYPGYAATSDGHILSRETGDYVRESIQSSGYRQVSVKLDGKWVCRLVHRLVALAYLPNPENLAEVDHLDFDPSNNSISNLRWVTVEENRRRKTDARTYLTEEDTETILRLSKDHKGSHIAKEMNLRPATVYAILNANKEQENESNI